MMQRDMTIDQFLQAIREVESGDNYMFIGPRIEGHHAVGAYQIREDHWPMWAQAAGIPGAPWRDRRAQDRVAEYRAERYFRMFGSPEVAAIAWIGGTESARRIMQNGYEGPQSVRNPRIREYLAKFKEQETVLAQQPVDATVAKRGYKQTGSPGQWVMPVAGPNEWSKGSWMPSTLTHRGRTHGAIDVYAEKGTPIVAPVSGKVISTTSSKIGGYTARILGDDGITYYFAHMADAAVVGAGQRVLAGNHIGFVGNSGSAKNTKPHLHFSMKRAGGEAINPSSYLYGANEGMALPIANAYSSVKPDPESLPTQLTRFVDQLSNKVAGGQRDPNVLLSGDVMSNQGAAIGEAPSFLSGKDTTEITEGP